MCPRYTSAAADGASVDAIGVRARTGGARVSGRRRRPDRPARQRILMMRLGDRARSAAPSGREVGTDDLRVRRHSSLAAAAGRPAPDDRQTERLMAELMATRAQLRRYGNNVNQIARTLNAGAEPPEWLTSAIALTDRVVHNIDRAVQYLLEQPRGRA